jgi:PPOX class probable F420-dependent enzyme
VDLSIAIAFSRERHQGVLVTRRRDGRPQLSNILFGIGDDAIARISVTDSRAKTNNLRRDPAASLYIPGDSFWSYAVLDGTAELSAVAESTDDAVVEELVELFRSIRGEDHPDWVEYRRAMVDERRLVVRFRPTHAYGNLG